VFIAQSKSEDGLKAVQVMQNYANGEGVPEGEFHLASQGEFELEALKLIPKGLVLEGTIKLDLGHSILVMRELLCSDLYGFDSQKEGKAFIRAILKTERIVWVFFSLVRENSDGSYSVEQEGYATPFQEFFPGIKAAWMIDSKAEVEELKMTEASKLI